MDITQVLLGGLATMVVYAVIVAGVIKLFHMASDLGEIKDALLEIKRNTQDVLPRVPVPPPLEFQIR